MCSDMRDRTLCRSF